MLPDTFPHPFGHMPPQVLAYERRYHPPTGGYRESDGKLSYGPVELEVGRLWYSMVLLNRPQLVLETGTHEGYSTSCIASALWFLGQQGAVMTIDPAPLKQVWQGTELEKHIRLVKKMSQEAKPEVQAFLNGRQFDMLVLDSDHHYDTIMDELIIYEPMLRDGGVILLHDTLFFDGVGMAVEQLTRNNRFECLTLDSPRHHEYGTLRCPGITIVRKKASGQPLLRFDESRRGVFHGDVETPSFLRTTAP